MTITTNPVRNQYTAINNQTVFNYTFKIYDSTDLNVYLTPAGQEPDDNNDLITSYTVDPNTIGDENGGFLTLDTGANAGDTLTIVSSIPYDRETDYQVNGDFAPSTVNNDFDRVVSLVKQNQGDIQRAVLLPESGDGQNVTIPNPSEQEGLKWESGKLVNTPITETVSTDSTEYKLVAVTGNEVKVRGLKQGQNVTLTDDGTDITIKAEVQGGQGDVSTSASNTYDNGTTQTFDRAVAEGVNLVGATATIDKSVAYNEDNTAGSDSVIVGALDPYKRFRVEGNISVVNQSLSGANSITLQAFFYQKDGTQYNQSDPFDVVVASTAILNDDSGAKLRRVFQDVFFSGSNRNYLSLGDLDLSASNPNGSVLFDMVFESSLPIDLGYFKIGYQRGVGDGTEALELSGLIKVTGLA